MAEQLRRHQASSHLEDAVLHARDGRGRVLQITSEKNVASVLESARRFGGHVVEVHARAELQGVVHGALVESLMRFPLPPSVADPPVLPVLSGTAPHRSVQCLVRALAGIMWTLSGDAPLVVVVHRPDLLDPWAKHWLADDGATSASGIVWVLAPSTETSTAHLARARTGKPPRAPGDTSSEKDTPHTALIEGAELRLARVLSASYVGLDSLELRTLSGMDLESVDAALAALRGTGRVVAVHGQHVLVDEQTRTTVLRRLPDALQVGLRREVISLMATRPGYPSILADAALELVRLGDRQLTDLLADAMATSAVADPEAAADYGLAAVAHLDSTSERLGALVWDLLPLLWRTARRDEARQLVARMFTERGEAEAEARVLLWLGRLEPSPVEALEHTRAGLALRGVSDLTRSRLLSVQLRCLSTLGRVDEVDAMLPSAIDLAMASGDPDSISRLRTCDAIRNFYRGNFNEAAFLTEVAESEWTASGAPHENRVPEMIWAPHLHAVSGQPLTALDRLTALLHDLPSGREALAAPLLHAERSQVFLALGRLEDARDEAVVAAGLWERVWGAEVSVNDRLSAILLAVRVKVAWHRGEDVDLAEVKHVLAESTPPPGTEAARRLDWYRFLVDDVDGVVGKDRLVDPDGLQWVPWLDPSDEVMTVRALLMQGYRWPAEQQVRRARARATSADGQHPLAMTIDAHLRGIFEWRREPLEEALVGWTQLHRPLLVSHARSDLASKLLEDGQPGGLEMMMQAQEELTSLGAHRDAWRVRQYLRLRGFEVHASPATPLTPAEARVAQRAVLTGHTVSRLAQDLSLSPHTVSTHLRHIYIKLGISSRAELCDWADQV